MFSYSLMNCLVICLLLLDIRKGFLKIHIEYVLSIGPHRNPLIHPHSELRTSAWRGWYLEDDHVDKDDTTIKNEYVSAQNVRNGVQFSLRH